MRIILSKLFSFIKYILFVLSFALVLFGIIKTYQRLDKNLIDSIPVFIPFALVLLGFIINMFVKNTISKNLYFNFVSCLVFGITIYICVRCMFDTNMLLFAKYGVYYNTLFLSDNLAFIKVMLYLLFVSNIILIIIDLMDRPKKKKEKVLSNTNDKVVDEII